MLSDNPIFSAPVRNISCYVELSVDGSFDYYTCHDKLKEFTIERIGESKFFGYGICQKVNVKLIDRERTCFPKTTDYVRPRFEGAFIAPRCLITEVHRDENDNSISITAYDKLYNAVNYTLADLNLPVSYTISTVAKACATKLGLLCIPPDFPAFALEFTEGANFEGTENLREVLNDIAEATQTIYYVSSADELIFKRLDMDNDPVLTINREQYFTLDTSDNRRLSAIVSATELGDNLEANNGLTGTTQVIRDNRFWDLREDRADLVNMALAAVGGLTIGQFDCSWRGNLFLEPCDKIAIIAKDESKLTSYILNDTISYNGTLTQRTQWKYDEDTVEHTDSANLGEAIHQTFAKVDKVNKQIDLVVSETATNTENISQLQLDTDSIQASVNSIQETTTNAFDGINEELAQLSEKASVTVSKDEVEILIQKELSNGVNKVETATGFTFNDEGLTVSKSTSDISTTITEDGMTINKGSQDVLSATNEGVKAIDLHATTYLIIGKNSRFEDYGSNRTACYWIGG